MSNEKRKRGEIMEGRGKVRCLIFFFIDSLKEDIKIAKLFTKIQSNLVHWTLDNIFGWGSIRIDW